MSSKHGNFLDDPFSFDAGYFNISPREAKSMDPQQRLLLHAAVDALDDAGYSPGASPSFQQDSFGVYVGVATGDYVDNLRSEIDVYYSPGTYGISHSGLYKSKSKNASSLSDIIFRNTESFSQRAYIVCLWIQRSFHGLGYGVFFIYSVDLSCVQSSQIW